MQATLPRARHASSSRWGRAAARSRKQRPHLTARAVSQIKVVGVGGHASHLVGQLWDNEAFSHLDMLIINTDVQELSATFMPDQDKLLIGSSATKWAGTSGNPTLGLEAAQESSGDISRALEEADVVLLLAGLGGGTGRGAGPVVADIARQQGAFTVVVALVPEQQHGSPHVDVLSALVWPPGVLADLHSAATALVVLPCAEQLPAVACLVAGIADLLMGYDAVDLEDVQSAVAGGTLRFAAAKGPGRVTRAVFAALSSTRDCLSNQLATGVLCFIAGAEDLEDEQMQEVQDVLSSQCSAAHTLLVRAVRGVDVPPPGAVAAAVLTTTPGRSVAEELTHLSTGDSESAARPLADAADAAAAVDGDDDAVGELGPPHEESG